MKNNGLRIALYGMLVLLSFTSFAQQAVQGGTPEQRAEHQTARMKEKLNLSAEQETTVAAINLKYAKQMQPLIDSGKRSISVAQQARGIMKSKDEELKGVFSKEQYKEYQQLKEEFKSEFKQKRRNN